MENILHFPTNQISDENNRLDKLEIRLQKRLGVSLTEYVGDHGKRSVEAQQKIDRTLRKKTVQLTTKYM